MRESLEGGLAFRLSQANKGECAAQYSTAHSPFLLFDAFSFFSPIALLPCLLNVIMLGQPDLGSWHHSQ
jgi:hypothetical protein